MNKNKLSSIDTVRRDAIVIFSDTTGFSNFARRTVDQPRLHREYLLALYQRSAQYQNQFGCFMKRNCDGVMFVHEYETRPTPKEVVRVLKELDRYQKDCELLIHQVPYPRPDGYRVRVTMGVAWKMIMSYAPENGCNNPSCSMLKEIDYWEYSTILAFRMLAFNKRVPLVCCQAVKEVASELPNIEFKKLPIERRTPEGIFKEDMADLWAIKSINL